jgi:uncharacterized OB-fold protein
MAFCANCGTQMGDGVKFCASCGTQAGGAAPAAPATEKVGNIRKCPACGAALESFQARCESCGHELNKVGVSSGIKDFFDTLAASDMQAQADPAANKGEGKKNLKFFIGLVVVLAIMVAILPWFLDIDEDMAVTGAVVIAVVVGIALMVKKVSFSASDNRKKGLIEVFPVPNSKEDLLEFLVMASSQILPANSITHTARKQQAWNKIWAVKCRQVYTKADIVLAGDEKALSIVKGIREKMESAFSANQKRMIIAAAASVLIIIGGVVAFNLQRSGTGVSVPALVTIPPENVKFSGTLGDNLKAVGKGITITWDNTTSRLKMTVELEAAAAANKFIEQKVAQTIKMKKWDNRYCTYSVDPSLSSVWINGFDHGTYGFKFWGAQDAYASAVLKLEPGVGQTVTVLDFIAKGMKMGKEKPKAETKKDVALFMALEDMDLDLHMTVQINYNPPTDAKGDWTTVVW